MKIVMDYLCLSQEFYPKKTDLALVKDEDLIESLKTINANQEND